MAGGETAPPRMQGPAMNTAAGASKNCTDNMEEDDVPTGGPSGVGTLHGLAAAGAPAMVGVGVGSLAAPLSTQGPAMNAAAGDSNSRTDDMEECDLPPGGSSGGGAHHGIAATGTSAMVGGVVDSVAAPPPHTQGTAMDTTAGASTTTSDAMEECDFPARGSSGGGAHLGLAAAVAGMSFTPWQPHPQQRSQATSHRIPYAPSPMDCGSDTVPAKLAGAGGFAGQPASATGGGPASAGRAAPPVTSRSISTRNAAIAGVSGAHVTDTTASSKPAGATGGGKGFGGSASIRQSAAFAVPLYGGSSSNSMSGSSGPVWAGGGGTATSHAWGIGGSSLPRNGAGAGSDARATRVAAPAPSVGRAVGSGGIWGLGRGSSNMGWGSLGSTASVGTPLGSLASTKVRCSRLDMSLESRQLTTTPAAFGLRAAPISPPSLGRMTGIIVSV